MSIEWHILQPQPAPCPACGRCPTCGHGGAPSPYSPPLNPYVPTWIPVYPTPWPIPDTIITTPNTVFPYSLGTFTESTT